MPTFIVFTKEHTHDQAELDRYQSQVGDSFAGHPVKLLAKGAPFALEGAQAEGMVILEFPTPAAARAWYDSPAYQAAAAHRFKGATYSVALVESSPA
ncbi:DUF1330 domain-containing protein [Pseudomonas tolaasii]|uniref:DUF1330 domain-containing protein n=1 Tax=Pseudomonas tolaasii TaxID=29442 RepID=UPI0015A22CCD|nr:DUF1330 domain-containing protein [Pseudomonas tolaasii]NWC30291.1 DUF1330 domain-containing protein [Pseudomonas tolaasii]NWC53392.1 DUF1330 domain-containing protein [Pseudomonas tolaasii]NWE61411.1 DUF1330 domain-containing protein [Pseudomonas tolaasii]